MERTHAAAGGVASYGVALWGCVGKICSIYVKVADHVADSAIY